MSKSTSFTKNQHWKRCYNEENQLFYKETSCWKMKLSQAKIWMSGAQANDENAQFERKLIVARKPPFKKHYRLDGVCLTWRLEIKGRIRLRLLSGNLPEDSHGWILDNCSSISRGVRGWSEMADVRGRIMKQTGLFRGAEQTDRATARPGASAWARRSGNCRPSRPDAAMELAKLGVFSVGISDVGRV